MDPVEFLFDTLIEAMTLAYLAMMQANHGILEGEANTHLRNMGVNLLKMGAVISSVAVPSTIMLAERILALPTYMVVILQVIVAFISVTGLAAMTIGMRLVVWENPARYHRVAAVILWASCATAPFAMGFLLCLAF